MAMLLKNLLKIKLMRQTLTPLSVEMRAYYSKLRGQIQSHWESLPVPILAVTQHGSMGARDTLLSNSCAGGQGH